MPKVPTPDPDAEPRHQAGNQQSEASSAGLTWKKSSFLADSAKILTSNVFVLGSAFISSIIIARFLGPEGKGVYTALLVYPLLLINLADLGVKNASVYLLNRFPEESETIIGNLVPLYLASTAFGTMVAVVLLLHLSPTSFDTHLVVLAALLIPMKLGLTYLSGILAGQNRMGAFATINWLTKFLYLVSLVFLLVFLGFNVGGAVAAMLLGTIPTLGYALYLVVGSVKVRPHFDPSTIWEVIKRGALYAGALFLSLLVYRIGFIFLDRSGNLEGLGHYSLALNLSELLWQVPAALSIVIFARSSRSRDGAAFSKNVAVAFRLTLIITTLCSLALMALAPVFVPFVYSDEFSPSVVLFQILLIGMVPVCGFKILNVDIAGKGRPGTTILACLPTLAMALLLFYFYVPRHGALGAAVVSTFSFFVLLGTYVFLYYRVTGISPARLFIPEKRDLEVIREQIRRLLGKPK